MPYALIDCNNFYASCERVFDPALQNRPVVILSNNDGCVISRSAGAKEAGIAMGAPEFKIRDLIRQNNVAVKSSNYALYGDMSMRVMETLRTITPDIEVYSIDEAFADIPGSTRFNILSTGYKIRKTVFRHTGIPVSVGIAPTKTLAKLANEEAKANSEVNGIFYLHSAEQIADLLKNTPVAEVWGIGRNFSRMLQREGVISALDLCRMPDGWIRKKMNVVGLRTAWELRGRPCYRLEECADARKGILSSRSFGRPVTSLDDLKEAVSTFTERAAEKLRAQNSCTANLTVTLVTSKYRYPGQPYKFGRTETLANPTANTSQLIRKATALVEDLFEPGKVYKKAWIMLTGLVPQSELQADLFAEQAYSKKEQHLMECLDQVNAKYGRRTVVPASTGLKQEWQMKQQFMSRRYTTRWDELMTVGF